MSKQPTIPDHDLRRIELLKEILRAKSQIDIIRAALDLLEQSVSRQERIKRWEKSAKAVAKNSIAINQLFRKAAKLFKSS